MNGEALYLNFSVITIVEAKNESTNVGLGQCIAEMVAAQRFNQAINRITESIYGAVRTGRIWRFLKLYGQNVAINNEELVIENAEDINVSKILAILSLPIKQLNS
ncbi:hypothetical protein [Okeania sp. KiyG1]|uniref:hypothetical protein n=1 Tax=Okeania sp. KiyG1 TaxID=2720165 RepID=UPI001920593E|nr:hypothetical protein [Okeania sp. KiyG1]GGA20516.1 hypothetical protein CYANOKiyG1_35440 [Okeania sp. KiyG1]